MTEILDKTKEWSDRFGGILRASAKTQFPWLYKGAVGGLQHVISVDNAGSYMELWRSGKNEGNYYATTGAAIKPLPGLAKGARLDEALDRFFHLMAKVEKDKAAMKRRLNMHQDAQGSTAHHKQRTAPKGVLNAPANDPRFRRSDRATRALWGDPSTWTDPQVVTSEEREKMREQYGYTGRISPRPQRFGERKAIPKKIKRLLGLKKRVMEKVDPKFVPPLRAFLLALS